MVMIMTDKRYYRLSDDWAYRGWYGRPFAISAIKGPNRRRPPFFFKESVYDYLLKCDGEIAIDLKETDEETRKCFEWLLDLGVIESSEEMPEPLEEEQKYKMYHSRFLEVAEWAITGRCNLRCEHCLVSAPDYHKKDLSMEDCRHIINELAECGVKRIELTGGEPFVRPDWKDIVAALSEKDISISNVFTNGLLVNGDVLDIFAQNRQHPEFQISYDGYGHHDTFRGVKGAQDGAEEAIRCLVARGFLVTASMCLTKDNKDSLRETVLRLSNLGVKELSVTIPMPVGRWAKRDDKALSFEQEKKVYEEYIPKYFEDKSPIDIQLGGYFQCGAGEKEYTIPYDRKPKDAAAYDKCSYCVEGTTRIFIDPDGRVSPCMGFSGTVLGPKFPSIFEHSLADITKDSFYRTLVSTKLSDLLKASEECRECPHFARCRGGCMLAGMTPKGNYLVPDPGICYYYKNGPIQNLSTNSQNC
ncbi:MAG: radical SAM protein [Lachnospiraceae bacterium]|nr:radical SAM protein [Lachnospiraceae bacterium]